MGLPQKVTRFTPEEYYRLERDAQHKSEYCEGEIFARAGASVNHGRICSNLIREVGIRLTGSPCEAFGSDMRLKVKATGLRAYPDVSVYCGPLEMDSEDPSGQTAMNPTVLFEVLSKTTENYDRYAKAENYRRIDSLKAHVLISQRAAHVEIYEREVDGSWRFREFSGLEATLTITSIGVTLALPDVYARVDFGAAE